MRARPGSLPLPHDAHRIEVRQVRAQTLDELDAQLFRRRRAQVRVVDYDASARRHGLGSVERRQPELEMPVVIRKPAPPLPVVAVGRVELDDGIAPGGIDAFEDESRLRELVTAEEAESFGEGHGIDPVQSRGRRQAAGHLGYRARRRRVHPQREAGQQGGTGEPERADEVGAHGAMVAPLLQLRLPHPIEDPPHLRHELAELLVPRDRRAAIAAPRECPASTHGIEGSIASRAAAARWATVSSPAAVGAIRQGRGHAPSPVYWREMASTANVSATQALVSPRVWLTVALTGLVVLLVTFHQVAQPDLMAAYGDPVVRLATLVCVLSGLGLVAIHWSRAVPAPAFERLLLGFAVVVAGWISLVETAVPLPPGQPVLGFSAVGPLILVMCVLVPAPTGWTLAAAMAAASTWPLAFAINVQRLDLPLPPLDRLIVWPSLNYFIALIACLIRRRVTERDSGRQNTDDLGSYRLVSPIGSGGMGEVWKAAHRHLARQAAIKLVRPNTTTTSARRLEEGARRFQREANAIAGLQSPHTIYLYDFGIARDGQFYYVMELLDGLSLETLVKTFGPQPACRVRHILLQICQSLEEAHQRNLVHRDLKPSNVMLCKVALTHDFVKVLDFGLAKCAACEDVTQITMEGVTAGTPGYIAPEVALGEEHVDGRADVYALGCVAYFLLTGSLVFPESNPMSMVVKHVQAEPTPPSQRTELPIPADLERVVLHCLRKKPADRPASAQEAAALFAACAVEPWTDADAAAWWARHLPATSSLRIPFDRHAGTPAAAGPA